MSAAHERVQMIRFPELFNRQVRKTESFDRQCRARNETQHRRQHRPLAYVRVHEERTAGLEYTRNLGERRFESFWREMLEHINRVSLRHTAVGKRQPAKLTDDKVDVRARLFGEE